MTSGALDAPSFSTLIYSAVDTTQAEFVFSDLALAPLEAAARSPAARAELAGRLVHVRLLLAPDAGRTPIADTAVNCSIRYVVLARGAVGVYAGGGFMRPRGTPGDRRLGGRIDGGSLRLTASSGAFVDRLGPASFAGTFRADREQSATSRALAAVHQLTREAERAAAGGAGGSSAGP